MSDGVPSGNLYGADLRKGYFELGYELFMDRGSLESVFLEADVFDEGGSGSGLGRLEGKMDFVWAASFLHLFGREKQVEACKKIVRLLKNKKDAAVLGRQVGSIKVRKSPFALGISEIGLVEVFPCSPP